MLLLNVEPEFDCVDSQAALNGMNNAEFVIAMTPFRSSVAETYANVMLPIGTYAETAGSFVNGEGRWQLFEGVCAPKGETRPAWKVLRVMGNLLGLDGFDYMTVENVHDEAVAQIGELSDATGQCVFAQSLGAEGTSVERIADLPMYATDAIIRRADALQETVDAHTAAVYLSKATAEQLAVTDGDKLDVQQGEGCITLPVIIDARVPAGAAYIPASLPGTIGLGNARSLLNIAKASGVATDEKVSAGNA